MIDKNILEQIKEIEQTIARKKQTISQAEKRIERLKWGRYTVNFISLLCSITVFLMLARGQEQGAGLINTIINTSFVIIISMLLSFSLYFYHRKNR